MLNRSLLDPRHFRIDDLLRRPYTRDARFGPSGPYLSASHPDGWGTGNGCHWGQKGDFGLFSLAIWVDGEAVMPGDAISRPSHLTLHGKSDDGAVQMTEDKFITRRDVAVSVLSLGNGGRYDADVQIDLTWRLSEGDQTLEGAPVYVLREAPPGDDLSIRLPAQSHRVLTILTAVASDRDAARKAAWSVYDAEEAAFPRRSAHYVLPDANPLLSHVRQYHGWFEANAPRFDCPDPWLAKLWFHGQHQRRRLNVSGNAVEPRLSGLAPAQVAAVVREPFAGDFDQPRFDPEAADWPDVILREVLGITLRGSHINVHPSPIAAGWEYFCLEDLPVEEHRLTLVWDDPASPADAYDDGDKGVTLYWNRQPVYHAATLAPFRLDLATVAEGAVRP